MSKLKFKIKIHCCQTLEALIHWVPPCLSYARSISMVGSSSNPELKCLADTSSWFPCKPGNIYKTSTTQIQSPDLAGVFRSHLAHTDRSNLLPSISCDCFISVERNKERSDNPRIRIEEIRACNFSCLTRDSLRSLLPPLNLLWTFPCLCNITKLVFTGHICTQDFNLDLWYIVHVTLLIISAYWALDLIRISFISEDTQLEDSVQLSSDGPCGRFLWTNYHWQEDHDSFPPCSLPLILHISVNSGENQHTQRAYKRHNEVDNSYLNIQ